MFSMVWVGCSLARRPWTDVVASGAMERRHVRFAALLGIGAALARRGVLAAIALGICALTALLACVVAGVLAARGGEAPGYAVPIVTSSALAWGGGFLLAFAGAASALRRDRSEGIRALFDARVTGAARSGYLIARVGGLAALLVLVVGGGTAVTGLIAMLGAVSAHAIPRTAQSAAAAVAYGVAFGVVVAPVAVAALGARARASGYLFLIAVLLAPEVLASMFEHVLPAELLEVCAIPSALAALRASIAPGTADVLRLVRSLLALAAFAGAAVLWIRRDLARMEREPG